MAVFNTYNRSRRIHDFGWSIPIDELISPDNYTVLNSDLPKLNPCNLDPHQRVEQFRFVVLVIPEKLWDVRETRNETRQRGEGKATKQQYSAGLSTLARMML